MKKMMFTLFAMLTIAATASAMSYEQARNEALFLTDKMAYELNLTDAQYEAAYEINLDYLMGVTSQYDVFGPYWERRNLDLNYILFSWQWDMFRAATYFYRPLYWSSGYWHFGIYARYPHRDYFYFGRPHFYASYRGGHSWRLNGGRSYYESRRDYYRPSDHNRDNHFGMRNSFDRGDYRGGRVAGGSSTRHNQGGNVDQGQRRGTFGASRNGGNRDNNGTMDVRRDNGNAQGTLRGTQPENNSNTRGTLDGNRHDGGSRTNTNGSFGGSRRAISPSTSTSTVNRQSMSSTRSAQTAPRAELRVSVPSNQRSVSATPQRSTSSASSIGGSRSGSSLSSSSHSGGGRGNFGGSRR